MSVGFKNPIHLFQVRAAQWLSVVKICELCANLPAKAEKNGEQHCEAKWQTDQQAGAHHNQHT